MMFYTLLVIYTNCILRFLFFTVLFTKAHLAKCALDYSNSSNVWKLPILKITAIFLRFVLTCVYKMHKLAKKFYH